MKVESSKGIEDALFKEKLLTPEQLSSLKLESANTGKSVDELLLTHKYVTEDQLIQARASLLDIPSVKLVGKAIPIDVLNLVPEPVARRYTLIPFERSGDTLSVAMADPLDLQVIEFVERKTKLEVKPVLAAGSDIQKAIDEQYAQSLSTDVSAALKETTSAKEKELPAENVGEVIREAPVAKIVSTLLEFGIKTKASDIHIEPQEDKTRIRYRIDGILHEKLVLPKKVHDAVVSRIKILAQLKIDEKRLPQDGRFNFKMGGEDIDLRISTLPTVEGEKIVMRLLKKTGAAPQLPELGLRGSALKNLEANILRPHGIVLITGPTGSGKTTTLYAILSKINSPKVNIITLEDPVEYQIPGVNQVQINPQAGLTFASGLRSFLRQDPNIIMVGEIRDTETAALAIQASLTGHLVFSTLHTNDASGALPRLLEMKAEPFLLASTMNCVVAQRVVRKICDYCKEVVLAPAELSQAIKAVLGKLLPDKEMQLYRGKGCPHCGDSGYTGRIGIFEVLPVTEKIGRHILERAPSGEIAKAATEEGMITLKQDGFLKALAGITSIEEILRVAEE